MRRNTPMEVFSKVLLDSPENCWEFQGSTDVNGYGWFQVHGVTKKAHRAAFAAFNPMTKDTVVMHSCDNPRCCNPHHLHAGTFQQNTRDCVLKGRFTSKLTADMARDIFLDNRCDRAVAREYGVDDSVVNKIRAGVRWQMATADLIRPTYQDGHFRSSSTGRFQRQFESLG